ncbi:L-serine dehydratase, iron-sulfur-dependent subunit beta [Listeria floridensis FSL S10-1187]|uniref:L-serine deaminase n=1 Tax=Listeria floridensis FSL S10-1187 TaxID=1265817 RepID=A0ABP3B2B9_9LIST|nr:L-serine ammonia-lyase, iron-sulfur-dependent subunit beta [Listeria floridensis]EUJ33452.1 L-serine dehydratase, iron-sulfur-dependent subunit beta [Listeria floridensis FSL S10-1187]
MKFNSVFDVIGPVMIGPSSSHTAGASRIGAIARSVFNEQPAQVDIHLYGSFAKTYKGHGTDVALIGGLLGFEPDDPRMKDSPKLAEDWGMHIQFIEETEEAPHPNTVKLVLKNGMKQMTLVGASIGGGKVEIIRLNEFELEFTGTAPALLILHEDKFGVIANTTRIIADHEINIGAMKVSRKVKGDDALMVIEVDQPVDQSLLDGIAKLKGVFQVASIII